MTVVDWLDETEKKYPGKIAFADDIEAMTFKSLRAATQHVGTMLIREGLFKQPVIVFLDRSPACVAAFLGVACSGNFYTPIDTEMPVTRIRKIVEILVPKVVITDAGHLETAREIFIGIRVVTYEQAQALPIDDLALQSARKKILDTDLLYVFFTSGSTGIPKGVTISHKAVMDCIMWFVEEFHFDQSTILGNQAPLYFDVSLQDVYVPICVGASTYFFQPELFSFPLRLLESLRDKAVNAICWVPSALCLVANLKALGSVRLPALKTILFMGEIMPNKQLNMWRAEFPEAMFVNLYGPTEITTLCTYYIVDRAFRNDEPLPIGKPCANMDVFVLDDQDCLVQDGAVGELCVRGTGLSYGYYNNPSKTKEAFVQNPLQPNYREFIYRTGDLARYNAYGELMYIGRKDFQIKHMGYRIELGEIEVAAMGIEGIRQACCLYDAERQRIVLFYAGDMASLPLKKKLGTLLPRYMVPGRLVALPEIPLNLNGKMDRVKLQTML